MEKGIKEALETIMSFFMAALTMTILGVLWFFLYVESRLPAFYLPKAQGNQLPAGLKEKLMLPPLR